MASNDIKTISTGVVVDGLDNDAYSKGDDSTIPSTSFSDDPPAYEDSTGASLDVEKVSVEVVPRDDEDDKILAVLRDVVRKCTNANPSKRPTAQEVLRMLEEVAPKELLGDPLDLSSDDDDDINKKLK